MKNLLLILCVCFGTIVFSQTVSFTNVQLNEVQPGTVIAVKANNRFILNTKEIDLIKTNLVKRLKETLNIDMNYVKSEIIQYDNGIYNLILTSDNGYVTKTYVEISNNNSISLRSMGTSCTTSGCSQDFGCVALSSACTPCTGDCTKTTTSPSIIATGL